VQRSIIMRFRTVEIGVAVAVCLSLHANAEAAARKKPVPPKKAVASRLPCGDWLAFQVRLDRLGFSSGEIDGKAGANVTRALKALQSAKNLPSTGQAD